MARSSLSAAGRLLNKNGVLIYLVSLEKGIIERTVKGHRGASIPFV
jgi:hypothetical protein